MNSESNLLGLHLYHWGKLLKMSLFLLLFISTIRDNNIINLIGFIVRIKYDHTYKHLDPFLTIVNAL